MVDGNITYLLTVDSDPWVGTQSDCRKNKTIYIKKTELQYFLENFTAICISGFDSYCGDSLDMCFKDEDYKS